MWATALSKMTAESMPEKQEGEIAKETTDVTV
jgi:hypothetical protein